MKKYRVYAKYTSKCYIDIEAESEEDAYEKAETEYSLCEFEPIEYEFNEPVPEYYNCEEID